MGKIVAITNFKGGVGKTATALNLGAALSDAGKKVLLIDNDPQGNLTAALGYTPAEQKRTLANLLLVAIDYPEDLEIHLERGILHTGNGLYLIPANRRLADAAARLQVMQISQYNALGDAGRVCEKVMDSIMPFLRDTYDYIIIDCGLKHELLTVNALAASDYCIIPVQSHFLASEGVPDVLDMVRSVKEKFNPRLEVAGILLTMYQTRPQLCRSVRESVVDIYGGSYHVFERPTFAGLRAAWLLVVICGLIIMFKVFKLILEIAERYIILAILTLCAPLAFGMGGSRNTSDIFTGWCRMFGSMCLVMVTNVIFFKMLLSVLSFVPSGLDVVLWMILVFGNVKVAKKIDAIITRIGLNPAITGDGLGGRSLPGMLTYAVVRAVGQQVAKSAGKNAGGRSHGGSTGPPGGGGPNGPRTGPVSGGPRFASTAGTAGRPTGADAPSGQQSGTAPGSAAPQPPGNPTQSGAAQGGTVQFGGQYMDARQQGVGTPQGAGISGSVNGVDSRTQSTAAQGRFWRFSGTGREVKRYSSECSRHGTSPSAPLVPLSCPCDFRDRLYQGGDRKSRRRRLHQEARQKRGLCPHGQRGPSPRRRL